MNPRGGEGESNPPHPKRVPLGVEDRGAHQELDRLRSWFTTPRSRMVVRSQLAPFNGRTTRRHSARPVEPVRIVGGPSDGGDTCYATTQHPLTTRPTTTTLNGGKATVTGSVAMTMLIERFHGGGTGPR